MLIERQFYELIIRNTNKLGTKRLRETDLHHLLMMFYLLISRISAINIILTNHFCYSRNWKLPYMINYNLASCEMQRGYQLGNTAKDFSLLSRLRIGWQERPLVFESKMEGPGKWFRHKTSSTGQVWQTLVFCLLFCLFPDYSISCPVVINGTFP